MINRELALSEYIKKRVEEQRANEAAETRPTRQQVVEKMSVEPGLRIIEDKADHIRANRLILSKHAQVTQNSFRRGEDIRIALIKQEIGLGHSLGLQ